MKKQNKFNLNTTLAFQSRNIMLAFLIFCTGMLAAGGVIESSNIIKSGKEINGEKLGTRGSPLYDAGSQTKSIVKEI